MKKYKIVCIILLIIAFISILINAVLILKDYTLVPDNEEEIERKWLIDTSNIPFDLDSAIQFNIVQTYINFSPEIRIRNINNGSYYVLTIKSNMSVDGLIRDEKEYYISEEEYNHLLSKQEGNTINKTRYQINYDNEIYEIDVFHDQLEGLAYLEIEFESEDKAREYNAPDWVIKEVTDDINYKNGHLARFGIPKSQ